jgi:hypothetical protein
VTLQQHRETHTTASDAASTTTLPLAVASHAQRNDNTTHLQTPTRAPFRGSFLMMPTTWQRRQCERVCPCDSTAQQLRSQATVRTTNSTSSSPAADGGRAPTPLAKPSTLSIIQAENDDGTRRRAPCGTRAALQPQGQHFFLPLAQACAAHASPLRGRRVTPINAQ